MPPSASKTILIAGAASGLGRAFTLALSRSIPHAAFILLDLDATGLQALADELKTDQVCELIVGDAADKMLWQRIADRPVSDLHFCVGAVAIGEIGTGRLDDWDWLIDVNLKGAIYATNTFASSIRAQRGSITLVSSRAAFSSAPHMGPYNITKAALISLAETLFNEMEADGVSVVVACPSYFKSNLGNNVRAVLPAQAQVARKMITSATKRAEDVVAGILKCHALHKLYYLPAGEDRLLWRLKRAFPVFALRLVRKKYLSALSEFT